MVLGGCWSPIDVAYLKPISRMFVLYAQQTVTTTKTKLADLDTQYQLVDKAKSAVSSRDGSSALLCFAVRKKNGCPLAVTLTLNHPIPTYLRWAWPWTCRAPPWRRRWS